MDLPWLAGRVVAVPLGALARWRQGKPMHPRGAVFEAVLERHGARPPFGVPFLDAAARDDVVVRLSRGAGLPPPWPDLLGLAVRLDTGSRDPVDLLLSTTGTGRLTRLVPVLRREAAAPYCSIMSYRSPAGPLRIAALPAPDAAPADPGGLAEVAPGRPSAFVLAAASGRAPWRPFARLTLGQAVPSLDPDLRFDAVRHPPPGLVADGVMARFRAPAYAAAQEARS